MSNAPSAHPEFDYVRSTPVASLNLEVQEFRHKGTGAPHYHLATQDDQNVFLVAFRTVPEDSTGVAHILEHTVLCGSRRFPVRDPFFMMTRRSLNTFMNAFTSSDWTAYPFASRNRKDFYNLMDVNLDAVFFPTIDPLDFAQEGHRVEFEKPDDPQSNLVFKGVVFNEMKGAMSSPVSALYQCLTEHLFPTITYHWNSGGDPEHIPDLSYDQLKAFHAQHYHPCNSVFMTYGDIPAHEHQAVFHDRALSHFRREPIYIRVPDEKRYPAPVEVATSYATDEQDMAEKTHIVLGWLLGRSTDIEEVLEAHLLSGVLLDNGASPLRHALETTDLGSAPSPLCGLQDSTHEMIFAAGLEGSEPERAAAVEQLIIDALEDVAANGVDKAMVEAILHQLEFSQREVSGDHYPYGLGLILNALSPAIHDADPVAALNIDPVLAQLRERIKNPDYLRGLARRLLLDNTHRVRLVMEPDPTLATTRLVAETERLARIKAELDDAGAQRIVSQAARLAERQARTDDPEILPKVTLGDIPADLPIPEGEETTIAGVKGTWFSRGTNGLVYQELVVDMPALDDELTATLPVFCNTLSEVGSGGRDYLATQALQAGVTGGLGARAVVRAAVDNLGATRGLFVVSGKALARNHGALTDLLRETFETARFDELTRLRELVAQERLHREQGVTSNGHGLAMAAATSTLSPAAALAHRWNGLLGIQTLKALDDSLEDRANLEAFGLRLEHLRNTLLEAPRQFLLVAEAEQRDAVLDAIARCWTGVTAPAAVSVFTPAPIQAARVQQAWATNTRVNFCARAYPSVPADHPDAAALLVLGGFLRNNFLHRAIREQGGAYGGGASWDGDTGAFRFYSYRDPRLAETLADFDRAVDWLVSRDHEWRLLEEAVLGVISAIDKPGSPAGEAKKAFHAALHGRTPEQRRRFRRQVLEVRQEDLKRVADTYLKPERAHTAVISNAATLEKAGLGLEIITL
ncbi:MAG: insulinase family protein [Thiohalomonadaceae bacterium]